MKGQEIGTKNRFWLNDRKNTKKIVLENERSLMLLIKVNFGTTQQTMTLKRVLN